MSLNAQRYILPELLEALVKASLADSKHNNKEPVPGERCRRAPLVHIGENVKGDLAKLARATTGALELQSF